MKFIHTADWHLGKIIHGVNLLEDQRYILKQFVALVKKEQADAVILAGDIYDRSVPSTDAIELLNDVLSEINIHLGVPVLVIAGNHDSAERLSFGSEWYQYTGLHVAGNLTAEMTPVHLNGVNFHLVPYAEPAVVRQLLKDDTIRTHADAMRAIVQEIVGKMDQTEPHVLVGHTFVSGGQVTDSERTLSVGGTSVVPADVFSPFAYTALGHLHSPRAINHETVHYSGSLLKYSFSEANQQKSVSIVEMASDGSFTLRYETLTPLHDMREIEGTLAQLLDPSFYKNEQVDDYLKITLLDEGALLDPMNKLRHVYPNVMHLERKRDLIDEKKHAHSYGRNDAKLSEIEQFEQFYKQVTSASFDQEKRDVMTRIIAEAQQEEERK